MNKPLSAVEFEAPAVLAVPCMTKHEKLLRLAQIVRARRAPFYIFSNIEYYGPSEWEFMVHPNSAFAAAAADPILRDEGLKEYASVLDAKRFFELSPRELHEFSCDCGGEITNKEMARRIEQIAARSA